jgi:hypothetical protein
MQAAQLRHHIGCRAAVRRRRQQEGLDAISQRQGAAAVRHDDTQLRVALPVPGEDQIGDCAGGIEDELDYGRRSAQGGLLPAGAGTT